MPKSKACKPVTEEFCAEKFLTPADHIAMLSADKDAAVAALEVERDAAKLQAFRLQTQMQVLQAESALKEVRLRAQASADMRQQLAAEVADRYAVNWQTHVLEPTTGQLIEAPKD